MIALGLELDFSYLSLNTGQAVASILMLYVISLGGLTKRKNGSRQIAPLNRSVVPQHSSPIGSYKRADVT